MRNSNSRQAIVSKAPLVGGIAFWFVAQTGPIASSVNAPRQGIRISNASIKTRVEWASPVVNTSRCFYIDTETWFPYIRLISDSGLTHKLRKNQDSAFAIWFGHSRAPTQQQMRLNTSSHSAPAAQIQESYF
jgi:hypothetical protein